MRSVRSFGVLFGFFASFLLVACSARHAPVTPEAVTPCALVPVGGSGFVDGRARFREIFREVLAARGEKSASGEPCDDSAVLWKLAGEPAPTGRPALSGTSRGAYRVVVVPGLLAECVAEKTRAFDDARERLENLGYKMDYIQTRGRRASAVNADFIHDAAMSMPPGGKLLFVTHSKGAPDTLEALAKHPDLVERTAAVVAVSGAVNGSPLAEAFPDFLYKLANEMPLSTCPPGNGMEAVECLRRSVRLSWLSAHPLPKSVRCYSLPAFALRENMSFALLPFYDILAGADPVNDGMVLCSDAIIPGSVLLGYPNADHMAVAMPLDKANAPVLKGLYNKNAYPRAALLEAVVRFVEEDLERGGR
ncbi:MAG: hypothetical protein ABFD98_06910 [Syntrophobacteraceae bacterium]|nr:hypothetical protein [Desulfobacteraceae bacterium]